MGNVWPRTAGLCRSRLHDLPVSGFTNCPPNGSGMVNRVAFLLVLDEPINDLDLETLELSQVTFASTEPAWKHPGELPDPVA